jgi:hypothetical protein
LPLSTRKDENIMLASYEWQHYFKALRAGSSTIQQDIGYMVACEGYSIPAARRAAIRAHIGWAFSALRCLLTDHKLQDNSYGGPDSGCIDLNCRRCGRNYHTALY